MSYFLLDQKCILKSVEKVNLWIARVRGYNVFAPVLTSTILYHDITTQIP